MAGTKQSGPRNKPTALAEAKGKVPFKPARNRDEPRPDQRMPPVPDWLPADAQDDWDYYGKVLDKVGVITVADGAILGTMCLSLWQIRRLMVVLEGEKDPRTTGAKRVADTLGAAILRMIRLAASLGLEPSSRAGLYTGEGAGKERSAMEKFQADGEKRQAGLRIAGT